MFARFAAGALSLERSHAPIDKDGAFDLRGLPPGAHVSARVAPPAPASARSSRPRPEADRAGRTDKRSTSSCARQHFDDGARVWVDARARISADTRAELDRCVATAPDVATSGLVPIGADNTDAGREVYREGDRHAVITGNSDGVVYTACARPTRRRPADVQAVRRREDRRYRRTTTGAIGAGVTSDPVRALM